MTGSAIIDILTYLEPLACLIALLVMIFRRQAGTYKFLTAFLAMRMMSNTINIVLLKLAHHQLLERHLAYKLYFYIYWSSYAIEAIFVMGIIYSLYLMAMAPLKGLQTLGMLMFRWAAGISIAVAIGMALGPRVTKVQFFTHAVSQLQQTQSILTLCMLLFVTFAIRPMGLSYRSKIFGVSLGLGIHAAMDLASSGWITLSVNMRSTMNLLNGVAIIVVIGVWTAYFVMPEPKRRIIVLPTTSPFLRWNQISQALGDSPGFVAVGGVPPEIFAPSELEIMRRASVKMAVNQVPQH